MKKTKLSSSRVVFFALLGMSPIFGFSQLKDGRQELEVKQSAPTFSIADINGKNVNLNDYRGKKVLITFYRNVGCPVCNLRFHELQDESSFFESKGLILLSIYESSADQMKKYLDGETAYSIMIPNEEQNLYTLYSVEKNMGKVMKGMFHGAMGKMKKGKKLFKTKIKQDGTQDRIGAEFLIDENGNLLKVYYGKFIGDHLPISEIKQIL